MKRFRIMAVVIFFISASNPALSEIYQWTDETGVVRFSDIPPDAVSAERGFSTMPSHENDLGNDVVEEPEISEDTDNQFDKFGIPLNPPENETVAPAEADYPESEVELYVTSWCSYCKKAREFFKQKGISVTEYDIEADKAANNRKMELDDNRPGVPFAVVNGHKIHGYMPDAYENALKNSQ